MEKSCGGKVIFLIWFCGLAFADTQVKYLYNYDGDTITFDYGKVRVLGVDSGELKSGKPCEKDSGLAAKAFVAKAMKGARLIVLKNHSKRDVYGRVLADVEYDGKNLKDELLARKLAAPYVVKRFQKINWCKVLNESKKL
jgi:endonuclease YncB( thermonuclease family)